MGCCITTCICLSGAWGGDTDLLSPPQAEQDENHWLHYWWLAVMFFSHQAIHCCSSFMFHFSVLAIKKLSSFKDWTNNLQTSKEPCFHQGLQAPKPALVLRGIYLVPLAATALKSEVWTHDLQSSSQELSAESYWICWDETPVWVPFLSCKKNLTLKEAFRPLGIEPATLNC